MSELTTLKDVNPLMQNEHVKELFGILRENGKDTAELTSLIHYVGSMESWLSKATDELSSMRKELAGMRELQNAPLKTALKNAIKSLETKIGEMCERLDELKADIIDGCKNAVTSFKEKGIEALNGLASFFHIKDGLDDWKQEIKSLVTTNEKTVAKIETFSKEYHTAGRHLKNMARAIAGKEVKSVVKGNGIIAKTLEAPYLVQISNLKRLEKAVTSAIGSLEKLEQMAMEHKPIERNPKSIDRKQIEKKPSMLEKLQTHKAQIDAQKRELPAMERAPKAHGLEV